MHKSLLALLLSAFIGHSYSSSAQQTYWDYHREIIACEELIVEQHFNEVILKLDSLFNKFDFVFLRDCKLATQLCCYLKNEDHAVKFAKRGMRHGWELKDIQKDKGLRFLRQSSKWENIQTDYEKLHGEYENGLNAVLRKQVHAMFKIDQRKALGAFIRIGEKAQQKYAEQKFAPHSEKQISEINIILDSIGYPGEQIIGNKLWASVILSHHNSISSQYNSKDTLYNYIRPKLLRAIDRGELSPYVMATIEDWRTAAISNHNLTTYGYLGKIQDAVVLDSVNSKRSELGIRSIELRNSLIEIEQKTGMNLYLKKDWQKGKISIAP